MNMLLTVENVTLTLPFKKICAQLTFQIKAGDCLGILGPNGCGKTTLLKTLAHLHPKTAGKICLNDEDITQLPRKKIAKKLGILFQETAFSFTQSVFEFCLSSRYAHLSAFGWEGEYDREIVRIALRAVGLENIQQQSINLLSGGEKQRLKIAALLAQTPEIYLLDEPFNHLDMHQQVQIFKHFKKMLIADNIGIAVVLHDINMAQHFCSHILLLFGDGEVLYGTRDHILTEKNLKRLYAHPIEILKVNEKIAWVWL